MTIGITVLGFTVPCDQPVVVCPNTTVQFSCSVQSNVLTWTVPTDINVADSQPLKLSVYISNNPITNDIYTATVNEGSNSSHTSSTLTVVVPSEIASNSIVCVRGFGNSDNDVPMSCPIVMESKSDTLYITCINCYQQVSHPHLSTLQ